MRPRVLLPALTAIVPPKLGWALPALGAAVVAGAVVAVAALGVGALALPHAVRATAVTASRPAMAVRRMGSLLRGFVAVDTHAPGARFAEIGSHPMSTTTRVAAVNGVELVVHEAGSGAPVILAHGFPES